MKLTDLEPRFVRHGEEGPVEMDIADPDYETTRNTHKEMRMRRFDRPVATLAEAHAVMFLCPLCFAKNGGDVGTHGVMVTFAGRGVPDHLGSRADDGSPSRWNASGAGLGDLTLTPSIWLKGAGCGWHGFVTNGDAS